MDEYDSSINGALSKKEFVSAHRHKAGAAAETQGVLSTFFSVLKSQCGLGARVFVTGVTPLVLSEFTNGFNIATFLHTRPDFAEMYGFTEQDVRRGIDSIRPKLSPEQMERVFDFLQEQHNGYFFDDEQPRGLFNPHRILFHLSEIQARLGMGRTAEAVLQKLPMITDSNSRYFQCSELFSQSFSPSSSILSLLQHMPSALTSVSMFLDARLRGRVRLGQPLFDLFRLDQLHKLANPDALYRLMFYFGAATLVPMHLQQVPSSAQWLSLPNAV